VLFCYRHSTTCELALKTRDTITILCKLQCVTFLNDAVVPLWRFCLVVDCIRGIVRWRREDEEPGWQVDWSSDSLNRLFFLPQTGCDCQWHGKPQQCEKCDVFFSLKHRSGYGGCRAPLCCLHLESQSMYADAVVAHSCHCRGWSSSAVDDLYSSTLVPPRVVLEVRLVSCV